MTITQPTVKAILGFLKWLIQGMWANLWKTLAILVVGGLVLTGYQCEIGPFKLTKKELSKPGIKVEASPMVPGIPSPPPSTPGKLPEMP